MKERKVEENVEESVRQFYDSEGWLEDESGKVRENHNFRDITGGRGDYGKKVTAKAARLLEKYGGTLLIAGSGDLPPDHERCTELFEYVICIDISSHALAICKRKLNNKVQCLNTSVLDIPLSPNSVDAVICGHMLYHVDRYHQEQAVQELIRVVKPGGRVVITYCNPNSPLMLIQRALKLLRVNKLLGKAKLYYFSFPLSWWTRFERDCAVKTLPYDAISNNQAKALIPLSWLRQRFYAWAGRLEDDRPNLATKLWTYTAIVLDKR